MFLHYNFPAYTTVNSPLKKNTGIFLFVQKHFSHRRGEIFHDSKFSRLRARTFSPSTVEVKPSEVYISISLWSNGQVVCDSVVLVYSSLFPLLFCNFAATTKQKWEKRTIHENDRAPTT